MSEAAFGLNSLTTYGAGIVALLMVFGALVYLFFKAPKFFKAWQEMVRVSDEERHIQLKTIADLNSCMAGMNATLVEVVRANTAAFENGSKSTENMAKALELLTAMYDRSNKDALAHDNRVQQMSLVISQISERTSACHTRRGDPK